MAFLNRESLYFLFCLPLEDFTADQPLNNSQSDSEGGVWGVILYYAPMSSLGKMNDMKEESIPFLGVLERCLNYFHKLETSEVQQEFS